MKKIILLSLLTIFSIIAKSQFKNIIPTKLTLTDRNMKTLQIVKPKSRESSIQLSGYKKDVYFLHVMFNNRKWVEKVLIE